jgi:hypothetical protein
LSRIDRPQVPHAARSAEIRGTSGGACAEAFDMIGEKARCFCNAKRRSWPLATDHIFMADGRFGCEADMAGPAAGSTRSLVTRRRHRRARDTPRPRPRTRLEIAVDQDGLYGRSARRTTAICDPPADVVGYSRLMGVDEEGTLAALKACHRELIDPKNRRTLRPYRQPRVTVLWSNLPARSTQPVVR